MRFQHRLASMDSPLLLCAIPFVIQIGSMLGPLGFSSNLRQTTLHISRSNAFSPSSICSGEIDELPARSRSNCSRTSRIWSARTTASGRPEKISLELVLVLMFALLVVLVLVVVLFAPVWVSALTVLFDELLLANSCSMIRRSNDRTYWSVWSFSVDRSWAS